ncbi:hypothetical protein A6A04_01735 [Paramagnetospirillum marisnigri]|uniref:Uncharacterized protein n=1 Tax=Paramagnetospirillum marisnigri TaxID=1285242 RepID=A0A178MQ50_9PROT|nr:hypothetical protein [Paramagnetospirillum marisnigri]OAN50157.1 hypothetical protein A6A04_01735 [Paramagnetospirillum marisnigri]
MALSAIALCSRALLRLGASPIASFEDGTAESEVAALLYPPLRDAVLSSHPWSFATAQGSLPRLAAAPVADFANAFQLPADFLRVLSAGPGGRGQGLTYRIHQDRLLCDAEEVVLTYVFRPDESGFPPFFDQMLMARLTAEFCIPVTESTTRAQFLFRLAEDEFRRAKLIDGQQQTPAAIADFPLVEVRS